MEKYTGRQIAILTDIHGLLEPTEAILADIRARGITEIYSLGDNIGEGPHPLEVVTLLEENGVKSIAGNAEEYVRLGVDPFPYVNKQSCLWTLSKLGEKGIGIVTLYPRFIELLVGGKKVGLCHFANDARIHFGEHSTWEYQGHFSATGEVRDKDASKQFEYTNSEAEKEDIKAQITKHGKDDPSMRGMLSVQSEPLFDGQLIELFDAIIQGHVHWKLYDKNDKTKFYTIRAAGMAYRTNPTDSASYVILRERADNQGFDLEEILVVYDRERMVASILNCTNPDKRIRRYTSITPAEIDNFNKKHGRQ